MNQPKNRGVAVLLTFVAPGLGHVYLGRSARGAVWLLAPFVVVLGVRLSISEVGRLPIALLVLAIVGGWLGAMADVVFMPRAKHREGGTAALAASAVAMCILGPIVAILFAVALRSTTIEAFKVPSGAMIPSVRVGDHFFADKVVYRKRPPRRGEVAIFEFPERRGTDFVKRVVGVGGDRIEVRSGRLVINGWEVPRCKVGKWKYTEDGGLDGATVHEGYLFVEFLEDAAYLTFYDSQAAMPDQGPYAVPNDAYFMMGDNRNNSYDSRLWFGGEGGSVARAKVFGRARTIWLAAPSRGEDVGPSRLGVDIGGPPVAVGPPELRAAAETCMRERPSRDRTTAPPPRP